MMSYIISAPLVFQCKYILFSVYTEGFSATTANKMSRVLLTVLLQSMVLWL